MNTIFTKIFDAPPFDKKEILRYAGTKESTPEITELIESCIEEAKDKLSYKVCYGHFPVSVKGNMADLSFMETESESLAKNLARCRSIILFGATMGIEIDRLISRYGRISPSRALVFQAIGAERIESLCDEFTRFIQKEYGTTVPRFSPGYGDLSLEVQKDFFRILEPSKRIGLTLNESMLMTPTKSVTAIIGITDVSCEEPNHNCKDCNKTDCMYRRAL